MDFSTCPICNLSIPLLELQRHANDHFSDENEDADFEFALRLSLIPSSPPRPVEDRRPDFWGSHESSSSSCDAKATTTGGNSNDERRASLICSQRKENFYAVDDGLMALLKKCLELESESSTSILCRHIDHFGSLKSWDVGWGCGWRNIQMLSSHLIRQRREAREVLYGGSGFVPDIGSLQQWLKLAWAKGYDIPGSCEFDQKIYGRRDWIGTTECAALFRFFGLHAKIVDFSNKEFELASSDVQLGFKKRKNSQVHGPMDTFLSTGKLDMSRTNSRVKENYRHSSVSSEDVRGHQVLSEWVWNYFTSNNTNNLGSNRVVISDKTPLYFQHDGHSRTIVGIQSKYHKNGKQQYNLLILDPAEKTWALEKSVRQNAGWQKLIERCPHTTEAAIPVMLY